MLCQGDDPLVTFDPRGGLQQWAGGGLALGQRPQVWEVCGLPAELPGACGQRQLVSVWGASDTRVRCGAILKCQLWRWADPSTSGHLLLLSCVMVQQLPLSRGAVVSGGGGMGAGWGPTWLLVPQVPLQVALVKLLQMLGEPLVVGQAGRAHGADGFHPIGAVAAAMVTYSRQG